MYNFNEILLRDASSLPTNMRTALIDKLIESLNVPLQKEIDQMWVEEAEKRANEIRSGKTKTISGEKVFRETRKRLKK